MRDTMLPLALAALDHVLVTHEHAKAGDWLERTALYHLTAASSHLTHARTILTNGLAADVKVAGHDLRTHVTHGLARFAMAVELMERRA